MPTSMRCCRKEISKSWGLKMSVAEKDIWPVLKDLFLEQYKGNLRAEIEAQGNSLPEGADNRLQGVLKVVVDKMMQPLDDACVELQNLLDIDTATGARLDFIARLANIKRLSGESDASFKARVVAAFFSDNEGTPDYAIATAAKLSGDTAPQYMDEAPATFIVYDGPVYERHDPETEGGEPYDELVKPAAQRQRLRREVKKLAPCGVLGLPGAAIKLSDGRLLCTSDHKKLILAVANDANSEVDTVLIDNGGNLMVTSQQEVVKVSLKGDARYQTTPIHVDGVPGTIDGIRVKDLPDAQNDEAYLLRDSDVGGTTKAAGVGESGFDSLWDNTPADPTDTETEGD